MTIALSVVVKRAGWKMSASARFTIMLKQARSIGKVFKFRTHWKEFAESRSKIAEDEQKSIIIATEEGDASTYEALKRSVASHHVQQSDESAPRDLPTLE